MSFGQFAASLVLGILSMLLPLIIFAGTVAVLVYVARRWMDRGAPRA